MLAEWTAECAADAPTLVVPWSDAESGLHFVNLREEPYDIAEITEAQEYPALALALRSLNAPRSPFLTAKCDAWFLHPSDDADELDALCMELDLDREEALAGMAGYIDLLWRDRAIFGSAHLQTEMLDRLTRRAERLFHPSASMACVLRPAIASFGEASLEGFAVTLYIRAVGHDPAAAQQHWAAAMDAITDLLRTRELAPARPSATID